MIPREVLFGNPVKTSPEVSPDARRLAYLAPVNNVLNVWIKTIGAKDDRPVTRDTDRGIRNYFWAEDNQHILYLQDIGGNENWRLYAVDLETGATKDFTPFDNVQSRIIDHNKDFPDELILGINKENPELHDAYHLNIKTGELKMVAKNPGNIIGWLTDTNLKIRGAIASRQDGGSELLIRDNESDPWTQIAVWSLEDSSNSSPVSFSKDGLSIYLLDSRGADVSRLMELSIASGRLKVIAKSPRYDVSGVMLHPDTLKIQAVTFTKARKVWLILDKSIRRDFKNIEKLDKGDFSIYSRDNSDNIWIVGFTKDNGPVAFYAYDRRAKKTEFLFYHKPDLKDYTLAWMEPISFKSRDGLFIYGYITYPPGKNKKNLPVVVNVHGGPWARDTWGYDPEAQWLANRGYACMQVNYRGSSGYGKKFLNAGNKQWGAKMHDDLVDAVNYLLKKGIADPKRIAIFGGSYGGYAALVGAAFTPDLFCCAVDLVGPSNLITFINSTPPYWHNFLTEIYKRIGDPETEKEFLESRSPLFKADNIKIPLFIAQGANDPRVKKEESEQIVRALRDKGIEYEYLLFPDEGHGFAKPQNRIRFYAAVEKFLAKYLNGSYEELE